MTEKSLWLRKAYTELIPHFEHYDLYPPNDLHICAVHTSKMKGAGGLFWNMDPPQLWVNTTINHTLEALGTLAHEMLHASLPDDVEHGPPFYQAAVAVGILPPYVGSEYRAETAGMEDDLQPNFIEAAKHIIDTFGKYPSCPRK